MGVLDRIQSAMVAWIESIHPTATVLWAPSKWPAAPGAGAAIITAQTLGGPTILGAVPAHSPTLTLPTAGTFVVETATVGTTAYIELSGLRWSHTVGAGETIEDVRDALLALIDQGLIDGTVTASGTDSILVSGSVVGSLYSPTAGGGVSWTPTATVEGRYRVCDTESRIRVQCFSASRYLRSGASKLALDIAAHVGSNAQQEIFEARAVSLVNQPYSIVPLDTLSGPDWESRAALDLNCTAPLVQAETTQFVEAVQGTLLGRDPSISIDAEAEL